MTPTESLIFAVLVIIALLIFLRRIYTLVNFITLGRWEHRFDRLWERFKGMIYYGFLQKRVIQKTFGLNHLMLFWGFLVLLPINAEFVISGLFPKFTLAFIGDTSYTILSLLADIMSAVVLLAVVFASIRRLFFKPQYLESTAEAYIILSTVGLLMVAYFGLNITALGLNEKPSEAVPVSAILTRLILHDIQGSSLYILNRVFWWAHAALFLFFLIFIPYSKHLHILASLPNCFFRNFSFPKSLSRIRFSKDASYGVSKITQFTWKDLLDFMACTECGRCLASCPANISGKALNPKQLIYHLKKNLMENGFHIINTRPFDTIGRPPEDIELPVPLIGSGNSSILEETVWECTTCGACVESCPVFIEHFPKLLNIRRHLIMEEVRFPEELISFFENIEARSNPWGLAPTERGKWAQNLNIPAFSAKEGHEYLIYAGCMGAFDTRTKKILSSLVSILKKVGIQYGILGSEEMCCGDAIRRLGNEYVFDSVAIKNVNLFKKMGVKNIITICPHCFNTLKNDYRAYGAEYNVFHHTEILNKLYRQYIFKTDNVFKDERIVFHDSCYLARYNNIYEEPRRIIEMITGRPPLEMEKNRKDSFCCGAGGGRMWLEDDANTRINRERTKQALKEGPTIIATSCPFCITMFEDGLKEIEGSEDIRVMDVCEFFVEGDKGIKDTDEEEKQNEEKRRVVNE
ncbi:MAG TPA: (Fe-S)-binding protein [Syntrophorhabdaceae bacterium]|nr:(Fe-S)-binding protein [Syntrophorhabdaceae bacterium]HPC66682.1 (Fe-S)-binding protein [Syntrophorhabdaceae bacterium]HQE79488.1 (Fe-S)-binding protein [Syntrophorhabdaceae bacterium]HRR71508.1 (Fe-S)-binding protein [Syntrophorhabdaceae bacterium]